jgi:hypothetical protein
VKGGGSNKRNSEEIGRIPVWVPVIKGATEVEHAGDDVHNQAEYEQERRSARKCAGHADVGLEVCRGASDACEAEELDESQQANEFEETGDLGEAGDFVDQGGDPLVWKGR